VSGLPAKDQLELATKVFAVIGGVVTPVKVLFAYVREHSLERRRVKTLDEMEICVKRLGTLDESKALSGPWEEEYRKQLYFSAEDCGAKLIQIREAQERLKRRRNEDSTGIRKWAGFYKPEGFSGWLAHTFYYFFCVYSVVMLALFINHRSSFEDASDALWVLGFTGGLALYFGSASYRLRRLGNMRRRGELESSNPDLGFLGRTFLLFKPISVGTFILQFLFVICLGDTIASQSLIEERGYLGLYLRVVLPLFFAGLAIVLRADALARRQELLLKRRAMAAHAT
jgi:hypothetical protein